MLKSVSIHEHFPECDFEESVFIFDKRYFAGMFELVDIAGKLATALLMSDKGLNLVINKLKDFYHPSGFIVDVHSIKPKLRDLLKRSFFATVDVFNTNIHDAVAFRRNLSQGSEITQFKAKAGLSSAGPLSSSAVC